MNTILKTTILVPVLCMLYSCSSSLSMMKSTGYNVTVETQGTTSSGNKEYFGELISIQDSVIYLLLAPKHNQIGTSERMVYIRIKEIQKINVENYANGKWVYAVLGFQVVPGILLQAAALSVEGGAVIVAGIIPAAVTSLFFIASTPSAPQIEIPQTADDLNDIKRFARFPQGLSVDQIKSFSVDRIFRK